MCGGVTFRLGDIPGEELERFFLAEELAAFEAMGRAESFFWARRPVLPIRATGQAGVVRLCDWGNREKGIALPRTGWARMESLDAGRWRHLSPAGIEIPAERGCEKKAWFEIAGTIAGVLVERDGVARAYMVTVPATPEYQARTGHDRMPKLLNGRIRFEEVRS
jgi:hypothetical protein